MQVGQRVFCSLYGGKTGVIGAIHGTPSPETCRTMHRGLMVTGGSATVDVLWDNGTESLKLPESLIRQSVQWKLFDEFWTESQIEAARKRLAAEKARQMEEAATARAAFDAGCADLLQKYPNLTLKDTEPYDAKRAAGNIRKLLKATWPKVKFSVRRDTNSIRVAWTDGPTYKQVDSIVMRFKAGHFNGMEDIYEFSQTPWNTLFGSISYIFTDRQNSVAAIQHGIDALWEIYPNVRDANKPTVEKPTYVEPWYSFWRNQPDSVMPELVQALITNYDWTQNTWLIDEGYNRHSFIVKNAIEHFAKKVKV